MSEFTFVVEKKCPICGESTRVVKIRSKIPVINTDEDFCAHYRGFNPYFYHIWVCEHCGFAADEKNFLSPMPAKYKANIRKYLEEKKLKFIFMEERGMPEAVASYRLAQLFADMQNFSLYQQAGILLRIAWLYRITEEKEKELEFMQQALTMYERSQATEHYPQGNMTVNDLTYLIGAIYYRMGNNEKCLRYLSDLRMVKDLRIVAPKVYEYTKKLWEKVREDSKEEFEQEKASRISRQKAKAKSKR